MAESAFPGGDPWYTADGAENDVIVSTRARLARNLANFQFPGTISPDDAERVQSLVFDSFSQLDTAQLFHLVRTSALDKLGAEILSERGAAGTPQGTGIIMRNDGRVSCLVNSVDHVRIASFAPGLSCSGVFNDCRAVDDGLQNTLQFAASYDFGYLTSSLNDAGSGMKLSLRVHLPSVSFCGKAEELVTELRNRGLSVSAVYGTGDDYGTSLGSYYEIATLSSEAGAEIDQIAGIEAAGRYCAETERKFRAECADNKPTAVHNVILRAFASAKFSTLMKLREAVSVVSAVKWGKDLGIISGIEDSVLCGLLYRIQNGHLEFLLENGNFRFERDIENSIPQKLERLRALTLQEAFEKTEFA